MRASGILMPVFSLPSPYGIGCFSREAYEFVDQLARAGQKYWQILPLGPTGYGDSPYQSFSTFAGNPYFIDPDQLAAEGLLTKEECEACDCKGRQCEIDYEKLYHVRGALLYKAYERSRSMPDAEFEAFIRANEAWLSDYAMYTEIKYRTGGKNFCEWEERLRLREPEAMEAVRVEYAEGIRYHKFVQFLFYKQWDRLKRYTNSLGIQVIGDIPIYVAYDSAETWAHPELFEIDEGGVPKAVAGVPPDGFTANGQLWGNPLYDWVYHKDTGYAWWMKRIRHSARMYDVVRIDHFRGFDEYYAVPYGEHTAKNGTWKKGPGYSLFETIKETLGDIRIIAEDLGYLTASVLKLVEDTGYPGMKVLQFAFDSREAGNYLPYNYEKNAVVYTGTHDNNTTRAWYETLDPDGRQMALDYLGKEALSGDETSWAFIRLAHASVAELCIIPIQDYLNLGEEARINEPSTIGKNWKWRLRPGQITEELTDRIRQVTETYGR